MSHAIPFHRPARANNAQASGYATKEELSALSSGDPAHDVILAQGVGLTFDETASWEHQRNKNIAVFGGSGAGKTRSVVLTNLVNHQDANYVITDTKGEILAATADGFKKDGYEVTVLDCVDPSRSCGFNPFQYIRREADVPKVCDILTECLDPRGGNRNDPFWDKAAAQLLYALTGTLLVLEQDYGRLAPEQNPNEPYLYLTVSNMVGLLRLMEVNGGDYDGSGDAPFDEMIKTIECGGRLEDFDITIKPHPNCFAAEQYAGIKQSANRTLRSIIVSLSVDLLRLRSGEIARIMDRDELNLDQIDKGKRVVFLVMSDNESSLSFLGRCAFRLILNRAVEKADRNSSGMLGRPLSFMCDEFPNLGALNEFNRVIATVRSRGINLMLFCQSYSQLKRAYGEVDAVNILDNCDTVMYLGGGSSVETADYMSRLCGNFTAGTQVVGLERNRFDIEQNVITPSGIARLPRSQCLIKISGVAPILATKYDAFDHPRAAEFLKKR